ncbi:hypothetical protein M407DRAFT_17083 [Tulasnella calospora MUT 4182]|uniref:Transmembrane protein n=1 Tax=Tulasnella calospora MUT 4182 TaxID=1051891 RepID=A0A0C3QWH2_9AGAM|nr:hypothetical protein M407DRAFT_17083 [Tulasnella calospora MUT 4182]
MASTWSSPGMAPYTDNPLLPPGMIFPSHAWQLVSSAVTLIGLSVLSYCFARRTDLGALWNPTDWRNLNWPKVCVVLIFVHSWLFIFCAGLLMSGAGLSTSRLNCSLAIFSCILLYAVSKLFIYLFLIEKVYVVWAPHGTARPSRLKSRIYCLCCALLLPLVIIIIVLLFGRIAHLRETDRVCVIGLRKGASLSLLCYDLAMTAILTTLFVYPLLRSKVSPRLRQVASRTLVASTAALVTSCANIAVLTVLHGKELGWVCLSSCGADVTINALAIYVVSSPGSKENSNNNNAAQNGRNSNRPTSSADEPRVLANGTPKPPLKFAHARASSWLHPQSSKEDLRAGDLTGAVPSSILAGRIVAPAQPDEEYGSKEDKDFRGTGERIVRIESPEPRRKSGTFWNGIASSLPFRHKTGSSEDQNIMSVQVTVTTEHQIAAPEEDEKEMTDSDATLSHTDETSNHNTV